MKLQTLVVGELLFVQVFAMEPEEGVGAAQVPGEASTELRAQAFSGLRLSCDFTNPQCLGTFLQTGFWRLLRERGWKDFVVTVILVF